MNFAVYDVESREILRQLSCPIEHLAVNLLASEGAEVVPPGIWDKSHYIDEITGLTEKEDYSISSLPLPCWITIEGMEYHCTEQPEFEFDAPGAYTIAVDAGPRYLKKEFVIENTPLLA